MTDHVELRSGAYADSVTLLQVSRRVQQVEGVETAQVAMATPLNLDVLAGMGFVVPPEATPHHLVVAVRLATDDVLPAALAEVEAALATRRTPGGPEVRVRPRTTLSALRDPEAGVVLVSVPGPSAAVEAMDALEAGRDVMVFSDNVPVAQELALKQYAAARDLLVMGPDCGTAVVGGVGLGFANVVAPGPVGIVAASGTGCQQVMSLLDHAGVGIAAALGVGGRDLSAEIGGLATHVALRRLDADPDVELIVLVSKPPADEVARDLEQLVAGLDTPVELALLGPGRPDLTMAVESVLTRLGVEVPEWPATGTTREAHPGVLRGLFVGGTLEHEAEVVIGGTQETELVDFGDDAYTSGRAHPMIDPTLRTEAIARAAADPTTGAILLDVVLGHGAEPDPAAGVADAIRGLDVPVVVTVVGTRHDPQDLDRQVRTLADAGAEVHLAHAGAVRRAMELTR